MRKRLFSIAILAVMTCVPSLVHAQDDFLFGSPRGQLTLRAGPMLYRVGGDLMGFMMESLTLERGDFRAPALTGELAVVIHPRVDMVLGAGYSSVEPSSEFQDWVEEDDSPITQVTKLRVIPLTVSMRFYPLSRGRAVSDLAWLPTRTTPYIGAGAGTSFYRLAQSGDFVDTEDLTIFTSSFETSGWTTTAHALAGIDHWFSPRLGANLEGRYVYDRARPGQDFHGWEALDLSGIQFGLGLTLRW